MAWHGPWRHRSATATTTTSLSSSSSSFIIDIIINSSSINSSIIIIMIVHQHHHHQERRFVLRGRIVLPQLSTDHYHPPEHIYTEHTHTKLATIIIRLHSSRHTIGFNKHWLHHTRAIHNIGLLKVDTNKICFVNVLTIHSTIDLPLSKAELNICIVSVCVCGYAWVSRQSEYAVETLSIGNHWL